LEQAPSATAREESVEEAAAKIIAIGDVRRSD
jgi:hypothetical protein